MSFGGGGVALAGGVGFVGALAGDFARAAVVIFGVAGERAGGRGAGRGAPVPGPGSFAPHPRQNLKWSWFSFPQFKQTITTDLGS